MLCALIECYFDRVFMLQMPRKILRCGSLNCHFVLTTSFYCLQFINLNHRKLTSHAKRIFCAEQKVNHARERRTMAKSVRQSVQVGFHVPPEDTQQNKTKLNKTNQIVKVTVMKIVTAHCRTHFKLDRCSTATRPSKQPFHDELKWARAMHTFRCPKKEHAATLKKITNLCISFICTNTVPYLFINCFTSERKHTQEKIAHWSVQPTGSRRTELTEAATIMKNQFYLQDHQFCNFALLAKKNRVALSQSPQWASQRCGE